MLTTVLHAVYRVIYVNIYTELPYREINQKQTAFLNTYDEVERQCRINLMRWKDSVGSV